MNGAIPPLRHVPFLRVDDTFIQIILDVVLQFVALWNYLLYVHSRSTLIEAWAEHVARVREMTYVMILNLGIWIEETIWDST